MKFATGKELLYLGLITLLFLIIVFTLSYFLPLREDAKQKIKDFNTEIYDINYQKIVDQNIDLDEKAKQLCQQMCLDYNNVVDYSVGPCLSDLFGFKLDDWSCDLVNNPRIEIDNKKGNKCTAYENGITKHFVEMDLNCNFVRLY
jgi:hypothetical protein